MSYSIFHGPGGYDPPDPDGYCHTCQRDDCICPPNTWLHLDDPERRATEQEATADLLGYDPVDAVVGFERLAVGL